MHPARRWLILSYFVQIDGMACAQHNDDRLPHLRRLGIEPILLSGPCGGRWPEGIHARVGCVAPSGIRFELRHLRRRHPGLRYLITFAALLLLPFILLEKLFVDLDSQWSWFPMAVLRGWLLCRSYQPELIYSTGGAASAHLAAALISRITGIPFVAEFQDPLVYDNWQRSRRALAITVWLERYICRRAAAVVFLTEAALARAASRTELGRRGRCIYPGANPLTQPEASYQRQEHCHFAHFGSLAGSRNLKVFLDAIQLLFVEHPEYCDLVRVDVYGSCDHSTKTMIERFPLPGIVTYFGRISRQDSLQAMERSDVLLLIQNTEELSRETIPSKTYEYLQVGRPILGLVYRNPELTAVLAGEGHIAVDAVSVAAVKEGIGILAKRWQEDGLDGRDGMSSFTVNSAVEMLGSIGRGCSLIGSDKRIRS